MKRLDDSESFEIDTPNLAFSILRPGVYRIHVNDNGDSTIIRVRGGEGEVTGGGSAYTVHAREGDYSTRRGSTRRPSLPAMAATMKTISTIGAPTATAMKIFQLQKRYVSG